MIGKVVKVMAMVSIDWQRIALSPHCGLYYAKTGGEQAMPDYLRVQDIVDRMGVSEETVRIWIRKKQLPAIRIGRDYFIDPNDFEEFLKRHRTDRKDDDKD